MKIWIKNKQMVKFLNFYIVFAPSMWSRVACMKLRLSSCSKFNYISKRCYKIALKEGRNNFTKLFGNLKF